MSREEVVSARGTSVWRAIGLHMLRAYDASWWRRCPRMSRDDFPNWAHTTFGWNHWEAWFIAADVVAGPACFLVRR